jgi:signal transduction histidine kinase
MRGRARRAIDVVAAYLAHDRQAPDPRTLAWLVGSATGAAGCVLTVAGERYRWGSGEGPWLEHLVRYGGEQQGILAVTPASIESLPAVAAVLGPPVAAVRLAAETDRLRRDGDAAARQLADDRWRAAVEMEHQRRALERDLHDGAQHHLVALRMALGLVEHAGGATPEMLAGLLTRLDTAERVLVDTAAGVLPITRAGLVTALTAELGDHEDVTLDLGGLRRRYPLVVESAVYFACLEAVNNAHKHAPGAPVTVTARDHRLGLEFVVADTGPGFTGPVSGSGLHNLSIRVGAVDGNVEVRSTPGVGTTVTGFVPG